MAIMTRINLKYAPVMRTTLFITFTLLVNISIVAAQTYNPPFQISNPESQESIVQLRISPNSDRVVFLVQNEGSGLQELLSVSASGGPLFSLSGKIPVDRGLFFRISPDGEHVRFKAGRLHN